MKFAPALLILLALPAMAGTLYRWTDAEGMVHFSDQPPPKDAKSASERNYGSSAAQAPTQKKSGLSVTLYTTATCGVHCERAKAHLAKRGISYTSKDPSTDVSANEALRANGGTPRVPTLMLGNDKIEGYLPAAWDAALDKAGFPPAAEGSK